MSGHDPLLDVENLEKHYPITRGALKGEVGRVRAVDGISFEVKPGETFGIVGESGCGKSTAATSLLRLEEPTGGEVRFEGDNILEYNRGKLRKFRRKAQMIFQDPDSSFNPRMNVGDAVAEPLIVQGMTDADRREAIVGDLLERVGLSAEDMKRYPHEFSGGQKQRLGLARALTVNPKLLVADEPVSALDVSVQSEILNLIDGFQEQLDLAVLLISHDLGVVREICDRVAVMYLGEFVEVAPTEQLFEDPQHPYTRALLSAIPTPDPTDRGLGTELTGTVPDPADPPSGCRFHTRCPEVIPPDDLSLPQESWRHVLHFRKQVLADSVDIPSIVEVGLVESDGKYADLEDPGPADVDTDDIDRWIRAEYDLPETLSDSHAEDALSTAISHLIEAEEDSLEAAAEVLDDMFTTPCERDTPSLDRTGEDHLGACHLIDRDEPVDDQRLLTD